MRHGPRPIDVDVLLLGGLEHRSERLTLPHPEITSRRFVLEPLLELDPALALPDGTPLAPLLDGLGDQPVRRVPGSHPADPGGKLRAPLRRLVLVEDHVEGLVVLGVARQRRT